MKKLRLSIKQSLMIIGTLLVFKAPVHSTEQESSEDQIFLNCLKNAIRVVPDYPKPGIQFFDIVPALTDAKAFQISMDYLERRYKNMAIDAIAGLDARGFIYGAALADRLKIAFIPIRKAGKLPGEKHQVEYKKEYGSDIFEMSLGSVKEPGARVVVIDDLIATGGTANAAIDLIDMEHGVVVEVAAIIEIPELKGRERIRAPVYTVLNLSTTTS